MNVFMTGASGFIGGRLVGKLLDDNHRLTILIRDPLKAKELATAGVKIFAGDLSDKEMLKSAMEECDWVFHLAAYARPGSIDPELPFITNVTGTLNVLEAAKEKSVKKVIITSTAGTLGWSHDGKPVDETASEGIDLKTEYERTKALMEKAALDYSSDNFEVIIVNPTRVYGPGKITLSNSVTRIIKLYSKGLWRILPGDGKSIGNYVFIDDVVRGIILAAANGKGGERYILGGENISYIDFFNVLGELYGHKRRMFKFKEPTLKRIAGFAATCSKIFNTQAIIGNEWIEKYLRDWIVSSDKAKRMLNYKITPFREGARITIQWLKA